MVGASGYIAAIIAMIVGGLLVLKIASRKDQGKPLSQLFLKSSPSTSSEKASQGRTNSFQAGTMLLACQGCLNFRKHHLAIVTVIRSEASPLVSGMGKPHRSQNSICFSVGGKSCQKPPGPRGRSEGGELIF